MPSKKKKQTKKTSSSASKRKSRKAPEKEPESKTPFWPLAGGILLLLLALFLLLGGFGTGGSLPTGLFSAGYWMFGWAAYLIPAIFVYWGVSIFSAEEHRLSPGKWIAPILMLLFIASWLFSAFAEREAGSWQGDYGGAIGQAFGGVVLQLIDRLPAMIMFFVLAVLAVFFALGISPKVFSKIGNLFKSKNTSSELGELKTKAEQSGFKLNEGVPVERGKSNFKDTAEKPPQQDQNQEALTTASDTEWKYPGLDLLNQKQDKADAGDVEANAKSIQETFSNFNINVEMEGANVGPRVTQYTLKPPTGVKLAKITALENNLALDLAAHAIRMEAPIPGKKAVGIEVPNVKAATVRLSSMFQSQEWSGVKSPLGFTIGKDIGGKTIVADLDRMPHILVAGQTGSGKSVMINTLLTSLLYRNSPSDLKLILVDPKQVELKPYDDIPHLLSPVITEPEKCISALKWAVAEMERRYKALAEERKRNIAEYNDVKKEQGMPYIVIVIDELADLMMMAARDVEALVVRIAQKARAVGIHLVLATQRPSVDVITGLIKANVPARIAFTTASQVDSRTIIDQVGAEKLLGQGDMLFMTADMPKPIRVQGSFIEDSETSKITDFIRMQRAPEYDDEIVSQPVQIGKGGVVTEVSSGGPDDDMFKDAVHCVIEGRKASTSLLQRRLRIGYGRAARLIEEMEERGIVGPADGSRPRDVLVNSTDEVFGGDTSQSTEETEPQSA